jgi:hypothetical protein
MIIGRHQTMEKMCVKRERKKKKKKKTWGLNKGLGTGRVWGAELSGWKRACRSWF